MNLRDLVTVLLRTLGIGVFVTVVRQMSFLVYYLLQATKGSVTSGIGGAGMGEWILVLIRNGLCPLLAGIVSLLTGIVSAVIGLFLIFGSLGISRFLQRLGYDHDRIADQRFSLRAWLIIIGMLAVLLVVARILTQSFHN